MSASDEDFMESMLKEKDQSSTMHMQNIPNEINESKFKIPNGSALKH